MDRVAKEKVVSDLTKKFDESNFFILTHNNGLSVHEITNLRDKLREAGSTFKVVKNSLAKIAVNDTKVKDLSEHFNGPLAIVFSKEFKRVNAFSSRRPSFKTTAFGALLHKPRQPDPSTLQCSSVTSSSISSKTASLPFLRHVPTWHTYISLLILVTMNGIFFFFK